MSLFRIDNDNIQNIKEEPFKLEKEIQTLCEENLELLLNLEFVKSEFQIDRFRLDSLAYDKKTNSFIIVEYKRDKNFSVIDQGYAYLSLMLNNKADFILEYNENSGKTIKRNEVDWSQSRVIFIAPSFSNYQKEAINFKDLPIELWEIKRFSNKTILFSQINTKGSTESIQTISKSNEEISYVSKEVKVYSEQDNIDNGSDETIELYEKIKIYILNLGDDINIRPTKLYIGFITKSNFCDIAILRSSIKIWINLQKGQLDDPKEVARDVSNVGHHGNGDYQIQISDAANLEYIISLVKQSYNLSKAT
ncbi:hypothetical protein B4O97_18710 [Marispirochaeta aestuarii]|uniref:DUF5655 domain-containing protein n=1 Tax=Marispirochaeta aestuarii TaxID=1963862 RepID=A0A1Y1RU00_9SPIO|nr:DUF5655 domain-containing protein [Marispirochaeta aestuarii]ORC29886.1 hypothetical protein B4O97_18710 [Marispirochaeta aestuarii]